MADVTISQLTRGTPAGNSLLPYSTGSSTLGVPVSGIFQNLYIYGNEGLILRNTAFNKTNLLLVNYLGSQAILTPDVGDWRTSLRLTSSASDSFPNSASLWVNNNVAMFITSAGDIGINNNSTPSAKLDVTGDIKASGYLLLRGTRIQECFSEHSDGTEGQSNIYYHYKTNIPTNSDCMYRIKAEGYHYQGANKLIEGWWSGYAWGGNNTIINSQNINSSVASNFCNRQYKSSDGFVVLVGFVSGTTYYYNVWFSFKSGTTSNNVGKINISSVLKTTDSSTNLF